MAIAGVRQRRPAFDGRVGRDRERAGLALAAVGRPCHRDPPLAAADDDVRDADRRAVVEPGAEVRVQADAEADARDQRVGVRIDRGRADIRVPGVVGRKRERAVQRRAGAERSRGKVAVARFAVVGSDRGAGRRRGRRAGRVVGGKAAADATTGGEPAGPEGGQCGASIDVDQTGLPRRGWRWKNCWSSCVDGVVNSSVSGRTVQVVTPKVAQRRRPSEDPTAARARRWLCDGRRGVPCCATTGVRTERKSDERTIRELPQAARPAGIGAEEWALRLELAACYRLSRRSAGPR